MKSVIITPEFCGPTTLEVCRFEQLHLNKTCRSQAYIVSHVSTTASIYFVLKHKQTKFTDLSHVNKRLKYCTLWYYRLAHEGPARIKRGFASGDRLYASWSLTCQNNVTNDLETLHFYEVVNFTIPNILIIILPVSKGRIFVHHPVS